MSVLRQSFCCPISQVSSDETPSPTLSLPLGHTHSVRPPITINLANFLGPAVPQGPHFGGLQQSKAPCCLPSYIMTWAQASLR